MVEQGSLSDKIRIESLENWVLKQSDEIKVLNERDGQDGVIEENRELENVKKKLLQLKSSKNRSSRVTVKSLEHKK